MSFSRLLYFYLWIAPHLLQAVLAYQFVKRKLISEFPAFFLYTVFEVAQFIVLFALSRIPSFPDNPYTWIWVVGSAISVALRFAIIQSIFDGLFESHPPLSTVGPHLLRWTTFVLVLVACVVVAFTSASADNILVVSLIVIDRAVSIVQCGLMLLLLALSYVMKISIDDYSMSIVVGLGIFASVELAVSAVRAHFGPWFGGRLLPDVTMATYHCCVVLWLLALPVKKRREPPISSPPVHDLEKWNKTVERLLQQ